MFDNKYPYTDFHELNLDWFLAEFKKVTDKVTTLDATVQEFTTFVTNYFNNLDVQEEINKKLDAMAADGSLSALIQPLFDEYKDQIDEIVDDQNEAIQTQNEKITTLEGRVNNLATIDPGSITTTADAELVDIRVEYDGVTAASAGDAVRSQISDLHDITDGINAVIYEKKTYTIGNDVMRYNTHSRLLTDGTLLGGSNADAYVSDFINIENYFIDEIVAVFNTSESQQCGICFYSSNSESDFLGYSRAYDSTVTSTWVELNTVPTIPEGTKFIRVAGRNAIVSGSPEITLAENVLVTDEKLSVDDFNSFNDIYEHVTLSKNIVGMKSEVYYPCFIKNGSKITFSTEDGEPSDQNYLLAFYDKDKVELGTYNFIRDLTTRTVTLSFGSDVYYTKWASVPALPTTRDLQVEIGDTATTFSKYFGNAKKNYEVLEELTEDTIITRCKDQMLNLMNASQYNREEYDKHDFNLLMCSDLHNDQQRMKNAFYLCQNNDMIDGIVNLGDTYGAAPSISGAAPFVAITNTTTKPAITLLGNHDQRVYEDTDITTEEIVDVYLKETNNGNIYEDGGWGSYDFTDYKIRLIALNSYDIPDTMSGGSYVYYGSEPIYRQNQIDWFVATLKSVPEDYTVVIAMHQSEPSTLDTDVIDPHFGYVGGSYPEGFVLGSIGRMSGTIISDIVDAYINKTAINESYTYSMNGSYPGSVTVNDTFAASNGTFACYITGHNHCQAIGHITAHMNQVVYYMDSSRAPINDSVWTEKSGMFSRDLTTMNQDSVVCISINPANRLIKFIRIGAHIDIFGKDYNIVTYTY